jgi:predicted MFS family arabinose efflux permease
VVIPLVSELSSDSDRAFNLSIVGTGPTLGILLARILSGVIADFTSWRQVYRMGLGIQICVFLALYLCMPDYPRLNNVSTGELFRTYPRILWSIVKLYFNYPVLVQACLLAFIVFTPLTAFWTTLTFLLSEAPYEYNTAVIGLFGLIGGVTLLLGPLFGKFIITPLRVPLYSVLIGFTFSLVGVIIGAFTGRQTVAGPVIEAVLLDAGLIIVFIANRLSIEGVEPGSRNRVNTAFSLVMHLGQLAGTKGGNEVYERYGGWLITGIWSIGILAAGYVVVMLRGPYESGWIGWTGGWKPRAPPKESDKTIGDDGGEKGLGEIQISSDGK